MNMGTSIEKENHIFNLGMDFDRSQGTKDVHNGLQKHNWAKITKTFLLIVSGGQKEAIL
jgi:hypothetical protein